VEEDFGYFLFFQYILIPALEVAAPVAFGTWVVSFLLLARRRGARFLTSLIIAFGIAGLTLCGFTYLALRQ
jgi:phosphoglycerol transferase MdoB-like AlkP superfamily enzyme